MKSLLTLLLFMVVNVANAQLESVIAHRGASYDAPENTTAAIALAIEHRAKIIEFDVRQTTDGKLFLFHDDELKRLSGELGKFRDLDSEKAAKLDVGSWFSKGDFSRETPPSLSTAIKQCIDGGSVPLIEHKSGTPEAYAKIIQDLGAVDQVIVQSFDWKFILGIKKLLPELKTGALGKKKLNAYHEILLKLKPDWVGWSDRDITDADIKWLKENEFHIAIWTVNDPIRAKRLLDKGVDKVITDRPKFIQERIGN